MTKQRPEFAYLEDIQRAAELAISFIEGIKRQDFDQDLKTQGAIMHQITIIGEATKNVSNEFRAAHPEIEWKNMAGMRDVLIHNYNEADLDIVWKVVTAKTSACGWVKWHGGKCHNLKPPPGYAGF